MIQDHILLFHIDQDCPGLIVGPFDALTCSECGKSVEITVEDKEST